MSQIKHKNMSPLFLRRGALRVLPLQNLVRVRPVGVKQEALRWMSFTIQAVAIKGN
jgi:hypothetical protein